MSELYPQIKWVHVIAVYASGALFLLRGLALHLGLAWPMAPGVCYASHAIDTVLLAAGVALTIAVHQYPFVHGWLTTKVVLLVIYIGLGMFALKRGRTRSIRVACWLAALAVYAYIISVARTHQPLGFFSG